jgi:hypothetical protein
MELKGDIFSMDGKRRILTVIFFDWTQVSSRKKHLKRRCGTYCLERVLERKDCGLQLRWPSLLDHWPLSHPFLVAQHLGFRVIWASADGETPVVPIEFEKQAYISHCWHRLRAIACQAAKAELGGQWVCAIRKIRLTRVFKNTKTSKLQLLFPGTNNISLINMNVEQSNSMR